MYSLAYIQKVQRFGYGIDPLLPLFQPARDLAEAQKPAYDKFDGVDKRVFWAFSEMTVAAEKAVDLYASDDDGARDKAYRQVVGTVVESIRALRAIQRYADDAPSAMQDALRPALKSVASVVAESKELLEGTAKISTLKTDAQREPQPFRKSDAIQQIRQKRLLFARGSVFGAILYVASTSPVLKAFEVPGLSTAVIGIAVKYNDAKRRRKRQDAELKAFSEELPFVLKIGGHEEPPHGQPQR